MATNPSGDIMSIHLGSHDKDLSDSQLEDNIT